MELIKVKSIFGWRKIYRLYRTAFPAYERKPLWLLLRAQRKGGSDVWILEDNGDFAGFAITLNVKDMVLLDYFAVAVQKREKGLGSEALRMLQNHYRGRRLFLEIESVYTEAENLPERKRRKQFYLRNGMTEMKMMVNLFGTTMELLGYNSTVAFEEYRSIYHTHFGKKAAEKVIKLEYTE